MLILKLSRPYEEKIESVDTLSFVKDLVLQNRYSHHSAEVIGESKLT